MAGIRPPGWCLGVSSGGENGCQVLSGDKVADTWDILVPKTWTKGATF